MDNIRFELYDDNVTVDSLLGRSAHLPSCFDTEGMIRIEHRPARTKASATILSTVDPCRAPQNPKGL